MADRLIREAERTGWNANLAIRYGLMTEGPLQGPLFLLDAKCAQEGCTRPLSSSDCSFCIEHFNPDFMVIREEPVALLGRDKTYPWNNHCLCRCCHDLESYALSGLCAGCKKSRRDCDKQSEACPGCDCPSTDPEGNPLPLELIDGS